MHPKYKRKAAKAKKAISSNGSSSKTVLDEQKQLQQRKFPGLSVPDAPWGRVDGLSKGEDKPVPLPPSLRDDDAMAALSAIGSRRDRPAAEDYLDGQPPSKRPYPGSQRDTHGSQQRHDGGFRERDSGYGGRLAGSGPPLSTQAYPSDGGRGRNGDLRRSHLDSQPVLYKIYEGTVSNVREFGAFVALDGLQNRTEGELLDSIKLTTQVWFMSPKSPVLESILLRTWSGGTSESK